VIRAVKGMKDLLPEEIPAWEGIEAVARRLFPRYGYREMRTPILEETELFARGIGVETDIVAKEMYTFEDKEGVSLPGSRDQDKTLLTLRPEATAGIVRCVIQHNLMNTDPALKVFTLGAMFRREQPQKGRLRQFHQVDVEVFGVSRPGIDVEIIEMGLAYLEECGLASFELLLNSVGDPNCRPAYVEVLREAARKRASEMCEDCQRRIENNPLRVLDCKVEADQPIIETLPRIADHLCPECRDHFAEVRRELAVLGIPYVLNHRLVRGLDYYTRTTFEVTTSLGVGSQNSVLGGGRYDGLVRDLGGPDLTGIGFALGMERLVLALEKQAPQARCDVFVSPLEAEAFDPALRLQMSLRRAGFRVLMDYEGRSVKARMRMADKLGARYVAILGRDELSKGVWTLRNMANSTQESIAEADVVGLLKEKLNV